MKLVPVTKEMPEIIWDSYRQVQEAFGVFPGVDPAKDIVIAGGCLSNAYMDQPIHDIDIFVRYDDAHKDHYVSRLSHFFGELKGEIEETICYYQHLDVPLLYRFMYRGYQVEIVFCQDVARVYDFDIRLRQFYLQNDQVQASERALQDIAEKKVVLACPFTPLCTFVRMHQFQDQFSFTIDEDSKHALLHLLGGAAHHEDVVHGIIETRKHLPKETKQAMYDFFGPFKDGENYLLPEHPFPYHASMEMLFRQLSNIGGLRRNYHSGALGVVGRNMEKIHAYGSTKKDIDGYIPLQWEMFPEVVQSVLDQMEKFIKSDRNLMLFEERHVSYQQKKSAQEIRENGEKALQSFLEQTHLFYQQQKEDFERVSMEEEKYTEHWEKWFQSLRQTFFSSHDFVPTVTETLTNQEYREIYREFYRLAYQEKDIISVIGTFVEGSPKYVRFFHHLLEYYQQHISEWNSYLLQSLLRRGVKVSVTRISDLHYHSLEEQLEGKEVWEMCMEHLRYTYYVDTTPTGEVSIECGANEERSFGEWVMYSLFQAAYPVIDTLLCEKKKETLRPPVARQQAALPF